MTPRPSTDAVIFGSGPNGLSAAVALARASKGVHGQCGVWAAQSALRRLGDGVTMGTRRA